MEKNLGLSLKSMAIGSLPHSDVESAMNIVRKMEIPFWPQLSKFNRNEDMILQFLEHVPGLVKSEEKYYLDNELESFYEDLEELFMDYEEIVSDINSELLDKYAISSENSSTFRPFLELVKTSKPQFVKGQIVGAFTLATTLTDKNNKCVYYDETLREIIVKVLTLKALWQIREIKKVSPDSTPIIFMDEPSISQLGTSAFITISRDEVVAIFKEISDIIQQNGGLCGIHCCGKCEWSVPIESGVNILNLDAYFYAQNLSLFEDDLKTFFENGGVVAWGVVPTLDAEALAKSDISVFADKFEKALGYLVQKGFDKKMLLEHSMVTPSCGAGSLNVELAEKAMNSVIELPKILREKYTA